MRVGRWELQWYWAGWWWPPALDRRKNKRQMLDLMLDVGPIRVVRWPKQ